MSPADAAPRTSRSDGVGSWRLLPIALVLGVVPLIVRLRIVALEGENFEHWTGATTRPDFFCYYKAIVFVLLAMLCLPFLHRARAVPRGLAVPLGLYAALALGSSLFSGYRTVSLFGFVDRYEGLLVLLGYVVVALTTSSLVSSVGHLTFLVRALYCSAAVIGIIGALQFAGHDPFKTTFLRALVLPSASRDVTLQVMSPGRAVYSTLYHYNYVGSYTAMILPFVTGVALTTASRRMAVASAALAVLISAVWIGSTSRAGYLGGLAGLAVVALFLWRTPVRGSRAIRASGLFGVLVLAIFLATRLTGGSLVGRLSELPQAPATAVTYFRPEGGGVHFDLFGKRLILDRRQEGVVLRAGDGRVLEVRPLDASGIMVVPDPGFEKMQVAIGLSHDRGKLRRAVVVAERGVSLHFDVSEESVVLPADDRFRPLPTDPVERWGFEGFEHVASGRGFVWSRTLPLLKQTVILGRGPDTFPIYFPQHDILGKLKAYGRLWVNVDKPHSLYLQVAFSTGLLSLGAFLAGVALFVVRSFRRFSGRMEWDAASSVGVAATAAVVGYLVAGLFNDSVVCVAPVFWVLLGLGTAAQRLSERAVADDPCQEGTGT